MLGSLARRPSTAGPCSQQQAVRQCPARPGTHLVLSTIVSARVRPAGRAELAPPRVWSGPSSSPGLLMPLCLSCRCCASLAASGNALPQARQRTVPAG